ncbi:hypothetical protein NDU88_001328 [Pleurodeles waltl]|uniref:Uncharacterized protein n=1 Tax=Pleurodeles waltl TaxID=8319 RepID=A0AAV7UTQ9_PLEWA|nr:hypothetical protein NDU88_001328 [Pleurodeles waltl]
MSGPEEKCRLTSVPALDLIGLLGPRGLMVEPARLEEELRVMAENKSHFFATPEAAWEWLESTGLASGGAAERTVPVPGSKRSRARHVRRRGEVRAGSVTCAPDLEQLIQERSEAIHSATTISASPLASESATELSQPPSDRPVTPDSLSELGLVGGPPVTPATADELF